MELKHPLHNLKDLNLFLLFQRKKINLLFLKFLVSQVMLTRFADMKEVDAALPDGVNVSNHSGWGRCTNNSPSANEPVFFATLLRQGETSSYFFFTAFFFFLGAAFLTLGTLAFLPYPLFIISPLSFISPICC